MENGWVYLYNIVNGDFTKVKFYIRNDQGNYFIFLNDNFGICYGGDNCIRALDISHNKRRAVLSAHTDRVTCAVIVDEILISTGMDGSLRYWDLTHYVCIENLRIEGMLARHISLSSDKR